MTGSSAFQFGRASFKAGLLGRRVLLGYALANLRYRLQGSTDALADRLRDEVAQLIGGVRVRDLERMGADVLAGVLPRLYSQMLAEAYSHQDADRRVYICTAASRELAELLAHVLTFDGAIGSAFEIRDGVYTGRADGPFIYREGKAQALQALAAREGIVLSDSYAYSDSESDLPMLRAVGHPVAVNPDAELLRVARQEGWRIMRFERLGRRLKVAGTALAAGGLGAVGGVLVRRRQVLAWPKRSGETTSALTRGTGAEPAGGRESTTDGRVTTRR